MAVGCGATCAKVILITFNFLFWLSGVALLILGIWILADPDIERTLLLVEDDAPGAIMTAYLAYALIGIGGLVFLIGFLGCCGALKENKCLLGLYLFFLIVIAGAEIAAGVLGFMHKDNIDKKIDTTLGDKWAKYEKTRGTRNDTLTSAIEFIETKLSCCGHKTYKQPAATPNPTVVNPPPANRCLGKEGCADKLKEWIDRNAPILIGVACGFGGLEIFGIICAICLCRAVGEKDE